MRLRWQFVFWFSIVTAGCSGPVPTPDVSSQVRLATGVGQDIRFREVGAPLDEEPAPTTAPTTAPARLTLPDAVRTALRTDPSVQASLARVHLAAADAWQARLLPNPVVSVVFRFPEGGGSAMIEAGLSADFVALLQRPRRISAADRRLRAAGSATLSTVLDVVAQVQERYAAVQALDAQAEVLKGRRRLIDRLLDVAHSRLRVGEGTQLDVLTLEAERLDVESEVLQRTAERTDQRLALARLLGRPSDAADWELDPWQPPALVAAEERAWVLAALGNRPEVQARVWELRALGDEAAVAGLGALEGAEVGVMAERDDGWSLGPAVAAPLPLFDWGQARRAKALAARVEARHMLVQTRRQVVEEVRRALAALAAARAAEELVRAQLVPVQQRRRDQAEAAYRAGNADSTTLLLAEQAMQEAQSKLIEVQEKYSAALFRLHRAAGGAGVAEWVEGRESH